MDFVHLHVHTQYSLLQGAIHLDNLLERVLEYQMKAVAITDMHNLFGAIDFYLQAKRYGIKPIIGCEVYFSNATRMEIKSDHFYQHLTLLCKNLEGYQNLCKLISESYEQSANFSKSALGQKANAQQLRAYVDEALLSKYASGLIVLSGCLRGPITSNIVLQRPEAAQHYLEWFSSQFKEDFYLELQDCGHPEQETINRFLYEWGQKNQVECVATADCHYLDAPDADAQEVLQCIEIGKQIAFNRAHSLVPSEYYFKSPQQMYEQFSRFPKACENTVAIAEKINLEFQFSDTQGRKIYHLPAFRPNDVLAEEEFCEATYLKEQAHIGLKKRFEHPSFQTKNYAQYVQRLEDELQMIIKTGFAGYFLIVADFINWAKNNHIPVGPGRGSGAGSLVAYSLRIIDIDPIEFHLLFERFVNPERISMPDFDVDFCQDRREEVIQYVAQKYGASNVCQIITFGKLQARVVLKDVGRVLGMPFAVTDQLTKLFPDGLDMTLDKVLKLEPKFQEKIDTDPQLSKVFYIAKKLEGLYRNAGIHAAGIIITAQPIVNYCPLYAGKDGHLVSQFDKDFCEAVGLVKFDFLGLKTLTVIDNSIKNIHKIGEVFELENMNYKDPKVFELISSGDTNGVFQVESAGMKDLCVRIVPSNLEDITAINALYRPGPLGSGMVDDFIDRKHGRKPITYETDLLAPILKDTYGVILYQEQVMQIARELAGYSLGQADLLRRAMGKKKPEEMAKHKQIFVQGASQKGLDVKKADTIFELMAKFAEYGFNKSHSAAYGMLTYQTAYLKTYFLPEFMAALMTTEMINIDKLSKYIQDAQAHGLTILCPDVNFSSRTFSVELMSGKKAIRFGLEAIKGVGSVAVEAILAAREQKPFQNILDLCQRVSTRKLNKKVLEALCLAGALDSIAEANRSTIFSSIENILEHCSSKQAQKDFGQIELFDLFQTDKVTVTQQVSVLFQQQPEWSFQRRLKLEKEVVGFYISGHPMDGWQTICEQWLGSSSQTVLQSNKKEIQCAGIIGSLKEVTTRKGSKMCFAELEDQYGKVETIFFPEVYQKFYDVIKKLQSEAVITVMTGTVESETENAKIIVKNIHPLEEAPQNLQLRIRLCTKTHSKEQLRELKQKLLQYRGSMPVRLDFDDPQFVCHLSLPAQYSIHLDPEFIQSIHKIFNKSVVFLEPREEHV